MSDAWDELDRRIQALAEDIIDQLNRDGDTPDGPVMLTSFALLIEGNGVTPVDGERITREHRTYEGSLSQLKGLLTDGLDQLRTEGETT